MNSTETNNTGPEISQELQQEIRVIEPAAYPFLLRQVSDLPARLYIRGPLPSDDHVFLTVVGSRRCSEYGRAACEALIAGLRGLPVVIVSGLAYGIDGIAHEAALAAGLKTIAVPGSGISDDMIYPAANRYLAQKILDAGGAVLSPFDQTTFGNVWTFPFRNRIMAGLSHATLVVEAELPSGTLITSKHALEFDRDVLCVPGSIFERKSAGPHDLISRGAVLVSSAKDLIQALGLEKDAEKRPPDALGLSEDERKVMEALAGPTEALRRDELITNTGLAAAQASVALSQLEIKGLVQERLGVIRRT